jgi:hypothetical protein
VNRWSTSSLVIGSQLALAAALASCVPLMPNFLFSSTMGGVSNYGVHARTVVPYSAGIVIAALLLLRASAQLALTGQDRVLALLCRITGALLLLNLLSTYPYQVAAPWDVLHKGCAILLAVAELVGAIAVAVLLLRDRAGYIAMTVAVVAFAVMALTLFGLLHVLFVAEVTTGVAFGILLVRAAGVADSRAAGPAGPSRAVPAAAQTVNQSWPEP